MNAHGDEVIGRRFFRKKVDHGAREFWAHSVDAEGHEFVGAEVAIAEVVHVLDELARDVMNREGEKLLLVQAGVAERFHPLDVIRAGGKTELAAAFAVAEAAVKTHDSGIAAQLEMDWRILR